MSKIRLIELFAGYGSQALALKNINADFEKHFVCDVSETAIKCYNALHNTNEKTKDIKEVHSKDLHITDLNKYTYILTYSFPCTDISYAGRREGFDKGSNTRSSLLWEVERILDELAADNSLPQILLMENVAAITSKKNLPNFKVWQDKLTQLGYTNTVAILNAQDYGTPQCRKRCFMVSMLNGKFEFPKPTPLKQTIQDILIFDKEYNKDLYLPIETQKHLISTLRDKEIKLLENGTNIRFCASRGRDRDNRGYRGPRENNTNYIQCLELKSDYRVSNTLTSFLKDNYIIEVDNTNYSIRAMSLREQGKLMGLKDEECERLEELVNSGKIRKNELTLTYANSIVVSVLECIFAKMLGI